MICSLSGNGPRSLKSASEVKVNLVRGMPTCSQNVVADIDHLEHLFFKEVISKVMGTSSDVANKDCTESMIQRKCLTYGTINTENVWHLT